MNKKQIPSLSVFTIVNKSEKISTLYRLAGEKIINKSQHSDRCGETKNSSTEAV